MELRIGIIFESRLGLVMPFPRRLVQTEHAKFSEASIR